MGEDERPRCRDCRWWKPERSRTDGVLFGECRRSSPIAVPVPRQAKWALPGKRNCWPFSGEGEWCGEFVPNERAHA